ncbi:hypothetical protein [Thermoanaerobacter sp. RKWS2]|nr:hypothetical protein [Thermoanaerobacter sp. RKWS2]UZQ84402.1 hypothetical protein OEI98_000045 [Thermoanaerobacter sp. RKWS2]
MEDLKANDKRSYIDNLIDFLEKDLYGCFITVQVAEQWNCRLQ